MSARHRLALLAVAIQANELLTLRDQTGPEAARVRERLREHLAKYDALPDDPPAARGASLLQWADDAVALSEAHALVLQAEAVLSRLHAQRDRMRPGPSKRTVSAAVAVAEATLEALKHRRDQWARELDDTQPAEWGRC
jgi:hypothetical protein